MSETEIAQLSESQVQLLRDLVDLAKITIPALVTLLAVYFTYRFATRQTLFRKRLDFIEKQIVGLYSPMIGCLKAIRASSELRLEISQAADEAWRELSSRCPTPPGPSDDDFAPYRRIIEYDNTQLKTSLLPLYDRMLSIFTENYWLAEDSTKEHYPELCRFVDIWHRHLEDSIPTDVVRKLDHREERLHALYEDLESILTALRSKLAEGGRLTRR